MPKGKHLRWHIFSPYCSVRVWQKLYAIWEFYGEEEAFCLSRIACFGPLNISRSFKQLCQHQAHTVNHQPTKCGAADFHNRQNGTSRESDTFPIKFLQLASSSMFSIANYMYEKKQVIKRKIQKKNPFSSALFWTMVKPRTLVTLRLSVRCSFFSLSEHSQVLTFFGPGFALLYAITYGVLYSNVKVWMKNVAHV